MNETIQRAADDYTTKILPSSSDLTAQIFISAAALMLLCSLIAALAFFWRALNARSVVCEGGGLRSGPLTLQGYPEPEQPGAEIVSVTITQIGTERHGKQTSHSWSEVDRKIMARPFYLRLSSGEKIRVEPGDSPLLIDELDETVRLSRDVRQKTARLTPGELARVSGVLVQGIDPRVDGGAYRDARQSWVLRPTRSAPMIVTSSSIGEPYQKRALYHAKWAGSWLAIVLLLRLWVFGSYYTSKNQGSVIWFEEASARSYQQYHKPKNRKEYYDTHYAVEVKYKNMDQVTPIESEVPIEIYDE